MPYSTTGYAYLSNIPHRNRGRDAHAYGTLVFSSGGSGSMRLAPLRFIVRPTANKGLSPGAAGFLGSGVPTGGQQPGPAGDERGECRHGGGLGPARLRRAADAGANIGHQQNGHPRCSILQAGALSIPNARRSLELKSSEPALPVRGAAGCRLCRHPI